MDHEDFIEHYQDVQRPLRAYLLASTGNLHETDDLSQVVWQVLWKKMDQYDPSRSFQAWSFGIARLEVLKWRQGKARSREVLSQEAISRLAKTGSDHVDALSDRHVFLLDCVSELADLSRKVLKMKYAEGYRSLEIGKTIERSTEAVDMLLSRTRKALRTCVERKAAEAR